MKGVMAQPLARKEEDGKDLPQRQAGQGRKQQEAKAASASAGTPQSTPTCPHSNVVNADGEMVCTSCGVVLDDDMLAAIHGCHDHDPVHNSALPQSWGGSESRSRPNLYTANVLGTTDAIPKMKETKLLSMYCRGGLETDRDRRNKARLSKMSNACEKLNLTEAQAQTAWTLFQRAAKRNSPRKIAEVAAWALYKTCQKHSVPITSDEILSVVRANFGRRRMPNMISILYANMASTDESLAVAGRGADGGEDGDDSNDASASSSPSTLGAGNNNNIAGAGTRTTTTTTDPRLIAKRRAAAAAAAAEAGTADANGGGGVDYYFALNMRRMLKGRRFSSEMFAAAKRDAWRLYNDVFKHGNRNVRTKKAIAMAFGVGM